MGTPLFEKSVSVITLGASPDPRSLEPSGAPYAEPPSTVSLSERPAARALGALAALLGVGVVAHHMYRANVPKTQYVKGSELYYR